MTLEISQSLFVAQQNLFNKIVALIEWIISSDENTCDGPLLVWHAMTEHLGDKI